MSEFLVEAYVSRNASPIDAPQLEAAGGVRLVRTIFVPEDETCFYLVEGSSLDVVREAALHAGVKVGRITEAITAG